MRSLHQQKGVTAIGWLIILALIGFFVMLTLKMLPSYLEYFKVVSTLESLEKEPGFSSPAEIKKMAEKSTVVTRSKDGPADGAGEVIDNRLVRLERFAAYLRLPE